MITVIILWSEEYMFYSTDHNITGMIMLYGIFLLPELESSCQEQTFVFPTKLILR